MDIKQSKISIIIPVFNKSSYTNKCLTKIYENTDPQINFEIIVVDNNSSDDTEDIIKSWKSNNENLIYIKLKKNFRFGYACNLGASYAGGDFLVFLNNDTEPQKNWLNAAISRLLSDEKIGIVGAKLLYPDLSIQHCGIDFYNNVNPDHKIWPLHRYLNYDKDDPIVNIAEEVPAITGAALFIKKALFFDVERFDLTYKMYFEDTDLCFKVRGKGYKVYYEPECTIIHHEGKSSENQEHIDNLNKLSGQIFYDKWQDEIEKIEEEIKFIKERNHFYTIYSNDIYPENFVQFNIDGTCEYNLKSFEQFFSRILSVGPAYYHFGGAGDALLLLSTFYDENPKQIIVSFANSTAALKNFFSSFPQLEHVYFLPIPEDPYLNNYIRKLLPKFSNVLGRGVTPSESYESEWNARLDIFSDYGVIKNPKWCHNFHEEKIEEFQVVIAPMGSNFGMYKSKKNIIATDNWKNIINFLKSRNISPVIIGVPTEEKYYPILDGCIDRRSYSFKEQMGIISNCDIFIGADSWGKTFSALSEVPTIVFQPVYGEDLDGWKDNSDFVFLDPWEKIVVVKNIDEFIDAFSEIENLLVNGLEQNINFRNQNLSDKKIPQTIHEDCQIIWNSPVFDISGYADESRNFIFGLNSRGLNLKLNPINWSSKNTELTKNEQTLLNTLVDKSADYSKFIFNLSHIFPPSFDHNSSFINIGRTMFETDSLPMKWIKDCNLMDEIWVPSDFNIKTFGNAGVSKDKLVKIPEAIDTDKFNLDVKPIPDLSKIKGFKFLSVFDWSLRKGWDVLLEAFLNVFRDNKHVYLIIKTWATNGKSHYEVQTEIQKYLNNKFSLKDMPSNIILYSKFIKDADYPRLYKSVDAYVAPTRGEGWGRPMMEAMAMALPTIATRWSGQLEFMNDENAFLIDYELKEVSKAASRETDWYEGHKWAEPSVNHLSKLMLDVYENNSEAKQKGKKARQHIINNFNREVVAKKIEDRLSLIVKSIQSKKKQEDKLLNIYWEGPLEKTSSIGIINSQITGKLSNSNKNFKISSKSPTDNQEQIDINVRHIFPPNLTEPKSGLWINIQPWEFGSLPKKWADVFSKKVDEMWVPSTYVKKIYVDSGIPQERVFVIPNGFDPNIFNRTNKKFSLDTRKKFKFLFVGGTIYRKGIDILLNAYSELFNQNDDVCLVIKDMGGDSFYSGQNFKTEIKMIQNNPNGPEVIYIDDFLPDKELAALYNSCDVLVHPYRGEGFGMPILEAMACGLPVLITNGGAALDFCDYSNSTLIEAKKVYYKDKKVGEDVTVDHPWLFEVSPQKLKEKMLYAYENIDDLNRKSKIAYNNVHSEYTLMNIIQKVEERILQISNNEIIRFSNTNLDELLDEAVSAFEKGEFDAAIKIVNQILYNEKFTSWENSDQIKEDLILLLGFSYNHINELEKSKDYFEQALSLNPESSQACFGLGMVFNNAEMYNEAKTMLEWSVFNDTGNKNAKKMLEEVNNKLNFPRNHNSLQNAEMVGT